MMVPRKANLRYLFTNFYQEHDPVTLSEGFDINELVELTTKKGVKEINIILYQKYGRVIGLKEELEGAMYADITDKEQQYWSKLYKFFKEVDPDMISAGEKEFGKYVQFAILNGMDKLNEKLLQKYGEGVDINTTDVVIHTSGINPFKLDRDRLKEDLKTFYTEMGDIDMLEVLDTMTAWACETGISEFDRKLSNLYGTGLNEFLKETGKPVHENFETPESRPLPAMDRPLETVVEADDDFDVVVEIIRTPRNPREFDEMTDDEMLDELKAFIKIYDEESLSNLEFILSNCREKGRTRINEWCLQSFGAKLTPVPAFNERTVKRKVPRPKQIVPLQPPTDIPIVSSPPAFENKNNSLSSF